MISSRSRPCSLIWAAIRYIIEVRLGRMHRWNSAMGPPAQTMTPGSPLPALDSPPVRVTVPHHLLDELQIPRGRSDGGRWGAAPFEHGSSCTAAPSRAGATVCWLTSSCTTSRSSRCAWTRPAAPFCSCAPQGGGGGARSPRPPSRTTSSPRCTCTSPTPLAPSRWPSSATSTQKPEPYPSTSSSPFSRQGGWRSLHPSPAPSASTWWTCMSSTTPGAGGLRSAGRNCAGTCTPRACPSPWSPTPPRSRVPRTSRARARPRASSRAPTKSSWWRPRRSRATPRRRRTTSSWRARGGGAWGTAGRSAAPPARSTRGCSTSSTPRV
mmetsp:Transcript_24115/g.75634  ORF Transcript_24115/g.75634 Transcript_24115/m.75634 type:complete len:324 (-) Transcript_24115:97-1068(-)